MTGLKLSALPDDKPVKLTIELPAALFADLAAYGAILGNASNPPAPIEPARLVVPMLQRFIASDRGFAKARRTAGQQHHRKGADKDIHVDDDAHG